jgi:Protein of unknown function (DUF3307)
MTWPALFAVFLISHLVGDFLLQTSWQANHKSHGLGSNSEARRALAWHGLIYTLAFLPALVWIGSESGVPAAAGIGALVLLPHVVIDDGTLVAAWVRHVKHVEGTPSVVVRLGVDQSLHVVGLAAIALLATG